MKHKHAIGGLLVILVIAVVMLVVFKHKQDIAATIKNLLNGGNTPATGGTQQPVLLPPANTTVQNAVNADGNKTVFPLTDGSTGKAVKMIQAALGVDVTGVWNDTTKNYLLNAFGETSVSKERFQKAFATISTKDVAANFPLKNGSRNGYVKDIQIVLGITADGIFGSNTESAVYNATGKKALYIYDFIDLVNKVLGTSIQYVDPAQTNAVSNLTGGIIGKKPALILA